MLRDFDKVGSILGVNKVLERTIDVVLLEPCDRGSIVVLVPLEFLSVLLELLLRIIAIRKSCYNYEHVTLLPNTCSLTTAYL